MLWTVMSFVEFETVHNSQTKTFKFVSKHSKLVLFEFDTWHGDKRELSLHIWTFKVSFNQIRPSSCNIVYRNINKMYISSGNQNRITIASLLRFYAHFFLFPIGNPCQLIPCFHTFSRSCSCENLVNRNIQGRAYNNLANFNRNRMNGIRTNAI